MTGALAQAMGLTVRYQTVFGDESFERTGDLAIEVGNVDLTAEERLRNPDFLSTDRDPLTVDFPPARGGRRRRPRAIGEHTVIAMFLNDRAVASPVSGAAPTLPAGGCAWRRSASGSLSPVAAWVAAATKDAR